MPRILSKQSYLFLSCFGISSLIMLFSLCTKADEKLAEVNGFPIYKETLSILAGSRENGPLAEMGANTDQLLDDLITTELLFQEAQNSELHKQKKIALELELAHKTLLAQLYVMHFIDSIALDENTLKTTYEQQEPKLMLRMVFWTFDNKANADAFLAKADLNTISSGEELPWQELANLPFSGSTDAKQLQTGQWLASPIEFESQWLVWHCLESSNIPKPPYEEYREAIKQELASEQLQQHIADLQQKAKVRILNQVE